MENGFYKYISKIVNIEDGISQLYDNLKQLQQENARLKDKIEKGLEELNKTNYEYSSRTEYANIIMNTKEILKEN